MATRRFILIDHSIRGFGGHHYEYAVHVLSAAQQAGFETILAVNRDFAAGTRADVPWRIVPVYEHGFWRNIPPPAPRSVNQDDWRRRYFEWKLHFKHGKFGQMLAMLPLFRRYYTPATIAMDARNRVQLLLMLMGLLLIKWPYNVATSTIYLFRVIVDPLEGYIARIGKALWHLLHMVFYPIRVLRHLELFKRKSRGPSKSGEFARDTAALFDQIGFREADVVFIPTLSDHDLGSLQKFLSSHAQSHLASWHLLFRRDLLNTEERRAGAALPSNGLAVHTFHRFHRATNGTPVHFYTDTDRLTQEYNALGISPFRTLPIPINPRLTDRAAESGVPRPLKVVYAGDARVEKGYHLLPEIVRDLHRNGHADDVVFRIQSNFAHARPQDATIEHLARTELQLYPPERVDIILTPLDSEKYHELVSSADVLLVLYDADNYFARSSGILVEALAAGIPVIAPAASWMGQQLAEGTYAYLTDRLLHAKVVSRHRQGDRDFPFRLRSDAAPGLPTTDRELRGESLKQSASQISGAESTHDGNPQPGDYSIDVMESGLAVSKPWEATGMFILFDPPLDGAAQVVLEVEQRRSGKRRLFESRMHHRVPGQDRCIGLFVLEAATDEIRIRLTNESREATLSMMGLVLVFTADDPQHLMVDAVGRSYLPGELVSDHLRVMVERYGHYRETARHFAQRWNERHSATRLVQELVS